MWGISKWLILGLFFFFPSAAMAFSFTPSSADLALQPGEEGAVSFSFFHNDGVERDYVVELKMAHVGNGPDEITFSPLDPEVGSWLSLSDSAFTVSSGEVKEVTLSVSVPASTAPQTHVLALLIVEESPEDGMIGASAGVAPLLFLSAGDLPASMEVTNFSADTLVRNAPPISFTFDIRNTGLQVLQPQGEIVMKNLFGETVEVIDINPTQRRVVGERMRTFEVQWGESYASGDFFQELTHEVTHFAFGWMTAELRVSSGEGGEPLRDQITLFLFPWRTLLIATGVVALLLGLSRLGKKR